MTFCCDNFKQNYNLGKIYDGDRLVKEVYPNIKIIKIASNQFNGGKNLYRFLIVAGFTKEPPPVLNVRFCPFCGTNLYDFYNSDEYINEDASVFSM
jgi:hypothetical protein